MVATHFSDIEKVIIENIRAAKAEIKIAVAWFNNTNIFECLIGKLTNNSVSLLLSNDKNNYDNGIDFSKFISAGGKLFLYSEKLLMHNKYLIVDDKTVITGSYNFTFGAEYLNKENVVLFKDELLIAKEFSDNFNALLKNSQEVVDFNLEINKTEDLTYRIIQQTILDSDFKFENHNLNDDLELAAKAIMEQYKLGNSRTKGRAILSLVEDKLPTTNNQNILVAAVLIYHSLGETSLATKYLQKINAFPMKDVY